MENLVIMNYFKKIYQGKRVLITGNTGFKGSWLAQWLLMLDAHVAGLSWSGASDESHFEILNLGYPTYNADIRDFASVQQVFDAVKPDIVFHLAAQALVLDSYTNPRTTYETNVMGTLNVLDAARLATCVKAFVVVTSDKCYENSEWVWGYRENDPFGGHDMYSSSKGCAELVTQSFRKSFIHGEVTMQIASARAGNVIGGGDFSANRIIPDLVRSVTQNKLVEIRNPKATRPWQHVLEPLSGYLLLGQKLLEEPDVYSEGWNFGPALDSNCSVSKLIELSQKNWAKINFEVKPDPNLPHEAHLLMLDCSKANKLLHWQPVWNLEQTVDQTFQWYKAWHEHGEIKTREQIETYCNEATNLSLEWTK